MVAIYARLIQVFEENNGILTTRMAEKHGISSFLLKNATDEKRIKAYSEGIYLLDDWYTDDLYLHQLKYPGIVYSHYTAIMLHWLSTATPFFYYFSLPKKHKELSFIEKYMKPHYVNTDELSNEFVMDIDSWDSNVIRVTNLEKTVIDSFNNESLMTFILEEMVDDYIDREDKNIPKLIEYAKQFGVMEVIEREILGKL